MEVNHAGNAYSQLLKTNKIGEGNKRNEYYKESKEQSPAAAKASVAIGDSSNVIYDRSNDKIEHNYIQEIEKNNKFSDEATVKNQRLKSMVEKLVKRQGLAYDTAKNIADSSDEILIPVDEDVRMEAENDISEKGYFGINQTSERIISFAKAISHGKSSKIDFIKSYAMQGFEEAAKHWNGNLPVICRETYNAVDRKFNDWSNTVQ